MAIRPCTGVKVWVIITAIMIITMMGRSEVGVEVVDGPGAIDRKAEVTEINPLQVAQTPVLREHHGDSACDISAAAAAAMGSGQVRGGLMSWDSQIDFKVAVNEIRSCCSEDEYENENGAAMNTW